MAQTIRVLLADDHPLVRAGIRSTLLQHDDIELVGEAANGDEVIAKAVELQPDILLLDLNMPGLPPLDVVATLQAKLPTIKILILSAFDDEVYVRAMLNAGVSGYIVKDDATEAVVQAIRTIMAGGSWFSRPIVDRLATLHRRDDSAIFNTLTPREKDVLRLIAVGASNAEIARDLGLTEQTVRNYVSRLYTKIGIETRGEAIVWARKHGLGVL